jgi:Uma2 family endonuclease
MSSLPAHANPASLSSDGLSLATQGVPPLNAASIAEIVIYPPDQGEELVIPASALTHEGFREWAISDDFPERGKIAYLDGELTIDMSPESLEEHNAVKTEVARVLATLVKSRKLGAFCVDGVLITAKAARLSNEPDAVFFFHETRKSGRVTFTPAKGRPQSSKEIVGAVDWVMEVVSLSSRRKDQKTLKTSYYKAGIPEYWLIDAMVDESAEIDFQILVAGRSHYESVKPADGWRASPTFDCSFKLTRERDENGFWEYTLHMQEKP